MTGPCSQERGDQSAGTCTGNEDLFGIIGFCDGDFSFKSGQRIDQAADVPAQIEIAQAGLGAADAGEDFLIFLGSYLCGKIGIGDRLAAEGDEIRAPVHQRALGNGGLIAADRDDRNIDGLLDHLCGELVEAVGHGGWRTHIGCGGIGHDRDIQSVDTAALRHAADHNGLFKRTAAVDLLVITEAEEKRIILAHFFADIFENFLRELHAAEEIAAEFICALVGMRRHELGDQIAVCTVHLDTVRAGSFGAHRGISVFIDDLPYTRIAHSLRYKVEHGTGHSGGRFGNLIENIGRHTLASGMVKLDDYLSALLMDRVHELFEHGNLVIVPETDLVHDRLALAVNGCDFDDDQPEPAFGAAPVIGDHLLGDLTVVGGEVRSHGRDDKAVFQFHGANLTRRKQLLKSHKILLSETVSQDLQILVLHRLCTFSQSTIL